MSYCNSYALHVTMTHTFYQILLFVTSVIFTVTLGLSLGSLFPNTETDDPEVISTSMPGLIFTGLILLYGAVCYLTLYLLLKRSTVIWLDAFVISSFFCMALILRYAPRSLESNKNSA